MLDFVKRPFIIHKPFDDFFGGHKLEDDQIFILLSRRLKLLIRVK